MREIKFRAWDIEEKRMLYLNIPGTVKILDDGECVFSDGLQDIGELKTVSSELELMQFTGLKDKNGEEIFDGDILALDNPIGDHREIVIAALEEYIGDRGAEFGYWWYSFVPGRIEILGNIYENSDKIPKAK